MNNSVQKRSLLAAAVIGGALAWLPLWAQGDNNIGQVTVKVTIIAPPPCTINNNQPIEVNFGDVLTTRVDGTNYRQPIDYNLNCPAAQLVKNALKLQIQGTDIYLGRATTALAVPGVSNFGIELRHDTTAFAPNTWLSFTYPNVPKLYAVPVMRVNSTLKTGVFSASSTMKVEYQ